MREVVVVEAGKIGSVVARLLADSGDYEVAIVDRAREAFDLMGAGPAIKPHVIGIEDGSKLVELLNGKAAVLSAAPFHVTPRVAEAARAAGAHYLDLTEDVAATRRIRQLADSASTAFIPQCGLAPGFISIVAADLVQRFDKLDTVKLRVGRS